MEAAVGTAFVALNKEIICISASGNRTGFTPELIAGQARDQLAETRA